MTAVLILAITDNLVHISLHTDYHFTFRVPDSMVLQSLKISTAVFGILLNIVSGIQVRIYLRIASTHGLDLIDLTFIKSQVLFKVYPSRDFSTNMTM